jgi:hypothetical protein
MAIIAVAAARTGPEIARPSNCMPSSLPDLDQANELTECSGRGSLRRFA